MIPMLAFALVVTVVLAYLMVRNAHSSALRRGQDIVETLSTGGLDAYRSAQGDPSEPTMHILSRHSRGLLNNQPAIVQTGWRFIYSSPLATTHDGLEIVIDARETPQGIRYRGWYEFWSWAPDTRSGVYQIETLETVEEGLLFTSVGGATFADGNILLDHDGVDTTDPIKMKMPKTFVSPADMWPAAFLLSQEQVPSVLLHMLRTTPAADGRFVTKVEEVCLTPATPDSAPHEMVSLRDKGLLHWKSATAAKAPGTDRIEAVYYFAESGELMAIDEQAILELPYSASRYNAPPQNVLRIAEQVFIRAGFQQDPTALTPVAPDPETDIEIDTDAGLIEDDE
jgi:hypothetical protein